mmetsp:Transcript_7736/g.22067  ORF Transcript_7736/g.22067 Transcript_7736/m.22067 type:complete len:279 (+) Transcript_7736:17-853(+)
MPASRRPQKDVAKSGGLARSPAGLVPDNTAASFGGEPRAPPHEETHRAGGSKHPGCQRDRRDVARRRFDIVDLAPEVVGGAGGHFKHGLANLRGLRRRRGNFRLCGCWRVSLAGLRGADRGAAGGTLGPLLRLGAGARRRGLGGGARLGCDGGAASAAPLRWRRRRRGRFRRGDLLARRVSGLRPWAPWNKWWGAHLKAGARQERARRCCCGGDGLNLRLGGARPRKLPGDELGRPARQRGVMVLLACPRPARHELDGGSIETARLPRAAARGRQTCS